VRDRGDNSVPAVFKTKAQAEAFINKRVAKGTTVQADEASGRDDLHARFEMKRINHEEAYSLDGACTLWAEEFSAACAGPRSPSPHRQDLSAPVCSRRHGARTIAASRMASKPIGLPVWH
jgi:hypothetical protein